MLKAIVWFLAVLLVVFVGGGYLLPGEVILQRQALIKAPPGKVFELVGGFKRFKEWSPWAELDPTTQYSFEGPDFGVGSKMSWASNNAGVGLGSQTITEYVPNSRVAVDLDFGAMGKSVAYWDLKPVDAGTEATWGFKMKLDGLMDRWVGLLMDRAIGPDYDRGLAKVKALAEKEAAGG